METQQYLPTKDTQLEALGEQIAEHAAHLDAATHRLLADIRTFDQGGGWYQQGARSCAQWLSWRVGWGVGTAREHVRVANKLAELPLIDDELRQGKISYCKVRAITRVALPTNEETLLEYARHATGSQLEAICRKYATVMRHDDGRRPSDDRERRFVTRIDQPDGMVKIIAIAHPEEAAIVFAALDRVASEQCRKQDGNEGTFRNEPSLPPDHVARAGAETVVPIDVTCDSRVVPERADADSAGTVVQIDVTNSAETSERVVVSDSAGTTCPDGVSESSARRVRAPNNFDRADALLQIAQDVVRGTRRERSPIEVSLSIPAEALRHAHCAAAPNIPERDAPQALPDASAVGCFADGTCVSQHAARRLACDCGVVDVIEDERGVALSIGRRRRTIPAAMKRALLRRDRTCRFPGCRTRVFLEGHHAEHWADGGETEIGNLLCLCTHHHRFLHEYGYTITFTPDGDPVFFDQHRRPVLDAPTLPHPEGRGFPAICDRNFPLAITAESQIPRWDGRPIDYHLAIDGLLRVDAPSV